MISGENKPIIHAYLQGDQCYFGEFKAKANKTEVEANKTEGEAKKDGVLCYKSWVGFFLHWVGMADGIKVFDIDKNETRRVYVDRDSLIHWAVSHKNETDVPDRIDNYIRNKNFEKAISIICTNFRKLKELNKTTSENKTTSNQIKSLKKTERHQEKATLQEKASLNLLRTQFYQDARNGKVDDLRETLHIVSDKTKNDALTQAILNEKIEVIELLLEDKNFIPHLDVISIASAENKGEIVKLLFKGFKERGIDPTTNIKDAIERASAAGHYELIKMILNDTQIINDVKKSLEAKKAIISGAMKKGDYTFIKGIPNDIKSLLEEKDVKLKEYALEMACLNGRSDIVAILLRDYKPINKDGHIDPNCLYRSLLNASKKNLVDSIEKLLAEIDQSNPKQYATALENVIIGSLRGHKDIYLEYKDQFLEIADADSKHRVLREVCQYGPASLATKLLDDENVTFTFLPTGTNVSSSVKPDLQIAIENNNRDVILAFLNHDRTPNLFKYRKAISDYGMQENSGLTLFILNLDKLQKP